MRGRGLSTRTFGGGGPIALALVFFLACALRMVVHGGVSFSPADEARYVAMSSAIARGGVGAFPQLVAEHLANSALHPFPSPLRYGHVLLGAMVCKLHGPPSFEALAALSLVASVVTLFATAALAFEFGGVSSAIWATLFVGVSPLELTLSRRALQDAVVVAAASLALLTYVRARHAAKPLVSQGLFVVAGTAFLAVKETSFAPYLAFLALGFADAIRARDARPIVVVAAPVFLAVSGFFALGGTTHDARELFRIAASNGDASYVRAYQAGPAHRVLLDLFALTPLATVAAIVGVWHVTSRASSAHAEVVRVLLVFMVVTFVVAAGLPKTVRFTAIAEPALAVFGAVAVHAALARVEGTLRRACSGALAAAAIGGSSWAIFVRVFLDRGVYDPTTFDVLAALDAVPHAGPMTTGTFATPLVVFAALAVGFAIASRDA